MSNDEHPAGISRRTLVKNTALGSLALAAESLASLRHAYRGGCSAKRHETR